MDIAYYLSELLMQHGEVNVPGLGYFVQIKIDGYYDDNQGKFYPPTHKTSFDPHYHDDNVFLQYIAEKKKISLASSKYFTGKYIDNLRLEAMQKDVPLADLGTLHFEDAMLSFKPADVLPVDPAYYGFEPISIKKLEGTSFYEQLEKEQSMHTFATPAPKPKPPVIQQEVPPVEQPELFIPQPTYSTAETTGHEEEFVFHGRGYAGEPEETERNNNWIWITITTIVVVIIVGLFVLYEFKPSAFDHLRSTKPSPLELKTPLKHDTVKITSGVKPDTNSNKTTDDTAVHVAPPVEITPTSTIDSTKVRFEVIGGTLATLAEANKLVENYKSMDIDAHIVDTTPGKHKFKVSLGSYATHDEAIDAINKLVESGKVKKGIWPLQINPK
jgi:cell division septation protein DedD